MTDEWIRDVLAVTRTRAHPLPNDKVHHILGLIADRYVDTAYEGQRLWETFHGDLARSRSDGWSLICDYPEPIPILLFQDGDEFRAYEFSSSESLKIVLAESPGFEFYVTNQMASFVLCHNHHDFIVGVGECNWWLSALETEKQLRETPLPRSGRLLVLIRPVTADPTRITRIGHALPSDLGHAPPPRRHAGFRQLRNRVRSILNIPDFLDDGAWPWINAWATVCGLGSTSWILGDGVSTNN